MQWWNDFLAWFGSEDGWRLLSTAIIPFVAIIVAGLLAAWIGRRSIHRVLEFQNSELSSAAVAAMIEAGRAATQWSAQSEAQQAHAEAQFSAGDIRLRLLPVHGAAAAADWATHEVKAMRRDSAGFSFQADQTYTEYRDRLLEWQSHPRRARKLFALDLERFRFEDANADSGFVEQQQRWAADEVAAAQTGLSSSDIAAADGGVDDIDEKPVETTPTLTPTSFVADAAPVTASSDAAAPAPATASTVGGATAAFPVGASATTFAALATSQRPSDDDSDGTTGTDSASSSEPHSWAFASSNEPADVIPVESVEVDSATEPDSTDADNSAQTTASDDEPANETAPESTGDTDDNIAVATDDETVERTGDGDAGSSDAAEHGDSSEPADSPSAAEPAALVQPPVAAKYLPRTPLFPRLSDLPGASARPGASLYGPPLVAVDTDNQTGEQTDEQPTDHTEEPATEVFGADEGEPTQAYSPFDLENATAAPAPSEGTAHDEDGSHSEMTWDNGDSDENDSDAEDAPAFLADEPSAEEHVEHGESSEGEEHHVDDQHEEQQHDEQHHDDGQQGEHHHDEHHHDEQHGDQHWEGEHRPW
jgi:hypothetical protein